MSFGMIYKILYDQNSELKRDKKRLQKDSLFSQKIKKYLELLSENPFSPSLSIKKIVPKTEQKFRLRVWDYRVIYSLDTGNKIILVHRIAPRKDIYR